MFFGVGELSPSVVVLSMPAVVDWSRSKDVVLSAVAEVFPLPLLLCFLCTFAMLD